MKLIALHKGIGIIGTKFQLNFQIDEQQQKKKETKNSSFASGQRNTRIN